MNDDRVTRVCAAAADWIERAADGTLGELDHKRLQEHLEICPACAALHDDALAVRSLVRATPRVVCPPRVVAAVLAEVDRAAAGAAPARGARSLRPLPAGLFHPRQRVPRPLSVRGWWGAGVALAAAAALLLLVPTVVRRSQAPAPQSLAQGSQPALTAEQRAQAQAAVEQTRLALAVLARTLDRTSMMAEENLRSSIATPLRRALQPRDRQQDQPPEIQQPERERRTGAIRGAAWMTGKC